MNLKNTLTQFLIAFLVTAVAVYFLVETWKLSVASLSSPSREGFGGVARGSGVPDCLRDSSEASELYSIFSNKKSKTEDGDDDLREFTLLLSKLCCFKKDLLSPSGIVEATRYQPYSTAHDIEPIAETTARCLAKTIPQRDLDIAFVKWGKRSSELIRKLCSSFGVSNEDVKLADKLLKALVDDVQNIANAECITGEVSIAGKSGPRDVGGFEPPMLKELRTYKGYY
jgi:hypothetical protein